MVNGADKFKNEDEAQKERISAKNGLESYIYNLKSTLEQDQVKSKLSEADLISTKAQLEDALSWLDKNQLVEKEEQQEKQKELETDLKKMMEKLYSSNGQQRQQAGGPGCGQQVRQGQAESTIEEVDQIIIF